MDCYCGSNKEYTDCCEIAHNDLSAVKTAEQLMRSRYTAYVMANGNYLMRSHHSATRPTKEKNAIVNWAKSVNWIRLEVLEKSKGSQKDNEGNVSFKAYYFEDGKVEVISENSAFTREDSNWVYLGLAENKE